MLSFEADAHMSPSSDMARGAGAGLSFETEDMNVSELIQEAARSFGRVNSLVSMPCRMSHASYRCEDEEGETDAGGCHWSMCRD